MRASPLAVTLCLVIASCASPSPSSSPATGSLPAKAPPSASASVPGDASPPPAAASAGTTPTPDPLASVRKPMSDLQATRLIAEVETSGAPDWQVAAFGSLWNGTGGDNPVVRVDLGTNRVGASIPVDGPCLGMAAGFGSVWSPSCGATTVDRIDPATNRVVARIAVPGIVGDGEGQLVAAFGSVWLFTDSIGTLTRLDPATNRVSATYHLGGGASIVATATALWSTVPDQDAVLELAPDVTVIRTISVGRAPRFIAAGEGAVWSLGQGDGDVTRIDPATGRVVATISVEVPGEGGCIAAGVGGVWVTMPDTPFSKIDPGSNTVVAQYTGAGGDCIGVGDGSVWLSNHDLHAVWRLRP